MAVSADLSKHLDEAYASKTIEEVLAAPVTALRGITEDDAEALKRAFRIKTVADLGRNKHFAAAQALVHLAK